MKRAKSEGKPQKHDAAYQDFFKSIRELVKYLGALRERAFVEYEPIVNGIIDSHSRDSKEIERTLDGLLGFCGNPAVLRLYKKLCRYYYHLDPAATATYIAYYLKQWEPERYKKMIKAHKKKK
jgi:hypothetical protein